MRRDKLVEMIKTIAREKLDETSHLPSSRYAGEKTVRQKKGLKLAQEEDEKIIKAATGGETVYIQNPTLRSTFQPR